MTHGLPEAGTWNQESRRPASRRVALGYNHAWPIQHRGGTERGGDRAPLGDKAEAGEAPACPESYES